MDYGFFCDTGPIRGICDVKDVHQNPSKFFFNKYPIEEYDFFVPETVLGELKGYKNRLRRHAKQMGISKDEFRYIRLVQQCMDRYIDKMIIFNCEDSSDKLDQVIISIQPVIGYNDINQRNDIEIVSNAIVWSTITNYSRRILITLDKNHLFKKRKKLTSTARKTLGEYVPLSICYLYYYYNKR